MKKIDILRNETYEEAMVQLDQHGKCAIIRPTGFGKTGILTKVIKSGKYEKILYLYPTEVIKNTVLNFYYGKKSKTSEIPGVTFMTYMALTNISDDKLKSLKDTDLIICDECHRLGAPGTRQGMRALVDALPNAHVLGATATPERMDMIDEIAIFFDDVLVSRYTLHDAFQDGVLIVPHYAFCAYGATDPADLVDLNRDPMLRTTDLSVEDREYAYELLQGRLIEMAKLAKMDLTIKQVLKDTHTDTTYQKYIVFCTNFARLRESRPKVTQWFSDAFPKHHINELVITSETAEYANNVNKLEMLTYKKNTIDLIFTCDLLNMGYHVSDITGIMMYRSTYSNIIYSQQFGRVLSSADTAPKLVFDVVDNLHRKSMYGIFSDTVSAELHGMTEEELAEYRELISRTGDKDEFGAPIHLSDAEMDRLYELSEIYNQHQDTQSGKFGNNRLYPEDLHLVPTAYTANYREIIAKTVAEVISMRCRQAWNRWIEKGGDDSILTRAYILGQHAPEAVPLDPFCRLKNVSVNAVLNEMGIA